jgi:hypothetical protein
MMQLIEAMNARIKEDTKRTGVKIDPDFKFKWVAALRSGEYPQGPAQLYSAETGGYCCLGVACMVAGYDNQELRGKSYIPAEFENVPTFIRGLTITANNLSSMNDNFHSFDEIADFIEKNL